MINKPYLSILLILIAFLSVMAIPFKLVFEAMNLSSENAINIDKIIQHAIIIFFSVFVIKKLKLSRIAGIGKDKFNSWYLLFIPLSFFLWFRLSHFLQFFLPNNTINNAEILIFLFVYLFAGLSEEFVFRGLIQSILIKQNINKKNAIIINVIIASSIFGALHFINIFSQGGLDELYSIISQVVWATFAGTMFGALLLRTNKLIFVGLLHGLINFTFNISRVIPMGKLVNDDLGSSTSIEEIISITLFIAFFSPMFFYGIYLLRKVNIEDVRDKIMNP